MTAERGFRSWWPRPRNWSLKTLLMALAVAGVLPVIALTGTALNALHASERERLQQRILTAANETASAVHREIGGMLVALETLATADQAAAGPSSTLHDRASRVAKLMGSNIVLFDAETGKQAVNTRVEYGADLPQGVDAWALETARTGTSRVSDLFNGQIVQRPLFGIYVPVIRGDRVVAVLASTYEPSRLAQVLQESVSMPGWIAAAVDRSGRILARSVNHERFVGTIAMSDVVQRAHAGERVIWNATNLEGDLVLVASGEPNPSGWVMFVAVPEQLLFAQLGAQWIRFLLLSLAAIAASAALGALIGRFVTRPILDLATAAHALGEGQVPEPVTSRLSEANVVGAALHAAGRERQRYEEHIRLLLREVNHRSKNMLAVVQAIARQTANGDPRHFHAAFSERLGALAASHDLLIESEWAGVDMRDLVRAELGRFQDLIGTRIVIDGPSGRLQPAAAQTLGMALHELATNAGKYGALSGDAGQVTITWHLTRDNGRRFRLVWSERGGPEVQPPDRRGFGTTLILDVPKLALKAIVELSFEASGACWSLEAPVSAILETEVTGAKADKGSSKPFATMAAADGPMLPTS